VIEHDRREPAAVDERAARRSLPVLTVDLDGVVIRPFFGLNLGIARVFLAPEAPAPVARVWPRWLGGPLDWLRFSPRKPLGGVAEALEALHEVRYVAAVTGRRSSPRRWLRRYGLDRYFDDIVINSGGMKSAHYKQEAVRRLGAAEHIDDDARTAQLLAQTTDARVFLRDWPRNRGLEYAPNVTRVRDLGELARMIAAGKRGNAVD
jgi:hypothetical protein